MAGSSAIATNRANSRSGVLFDQEGASVRLTRAISERAKRIFNKPYRALVDILHVSERDAHYKLKGRRKYRDVDIARLLQSDEGIHFLVVLMERKRPLWWREFLKMCAQVSVEQRRAQDIKLLQRAFNADKVAASAASDAMLLQDEDFYRIALEGFDWAASGGAVDGPVDR